MRKTSTVLRTANTLKMKILIAGRKVKTKKSGIKIPDFPDIT